MYSIARTRIRRTSRRTASKPRETQSVWMRPIVQRTVKKKKNTAFIIFDVCFAGPRVGARQTCVYRNERGEEALARIYLLLTIWKILKIRRPIATWSYSIIRRRFHDNFRGAHTAFTQNFTCAPETRARRTETRCRRRIFLFLSRPFNSRLLNARNNISSRASIRFHSHSPQCPRATTVLLRPVFPSGVSPARAVGNDGDREKRALSLSRAIDTAATGAHEARTHMNISEIFVFWKTKIFWFFFFFTPQTVRSISKSKFSFPFLL